MENYFNSKQNVYSTLKNRNFKLIAVDPGSTTGLAVFEVFEGNYRLLLSTEVGLDKVYVMLLELYQSYTPLVTVVENYLLFADKATAQIGSVLPAVEIKGLTLGIAFSVAVRELGEFPISVLQRPGSENSTAIRREDVKFVGGSKHRKDAYKHGRMFIEKLFANK